MEKPVKKRKCQSGKKALMLKEAYDYICEKTQIEPCDRAGARELRSAPNVIKAIGKLFTSGNVVCKVEKDRVEFLDKTIHDLKVELEKNKKEVIEVEGANNFNINELIRLKNRNLWQRIINKLDV